MENKTDNKENSKKKIIIIVVTVILVAACVAAAVIFGGKAGKDDGTTAGETEIVAVTDENGEPVTDENGNPVTEVVAVTEGESASAAESASQGGSSGTTAAGGTTTEGTTKKVISKPEKPKTVTGLKVKNATEDTLELTWDKVSCNGYQICYSTDEIHWEYYPKQAEMDSFHTANSIKLTGLEPYTRYYFYVRAYNMNEAGTSTSAWSAKIYGNTKEMKEARQITFTVKLPTDSNRKETLELWIDKEQVNEKDGTTVNLDGSEYTFTTKKKYKGIVIAWAGIGDGTVYNQEKVGGDSVYLDLSNNGVDQQYIDEEF